MKQLLVVIAAVLVAAEGAGRWKPGLRVRWGRGPFPNPEFFIPLPLSLNAAKAEKWVPSVAPAGMPKGLVFYTPSKDDVVVGTYYDASGKVAGLQISLPQDSYIDSELDFKIQGYKNWVAPVNSKGVQRKYWAQIAYFRDPASFTTKSASSLPGNEYIGEHVYVTGYNGTLMALSNKSDQVTNTARTGFNRQGCVPYMGRHYFYHMTKNTQCSTNTLFPWFTLLDPRKDVNQLIGIGFLSFGKLPPSKLIKDYFERPTASEVMYNVEDGPDCLRQLSDRAGVVTMHINFVDEPTTIDCVGM